MPPLERWLADAVPRLNPALLVAWFASQGVRCFHAYPDARLPEEGRGPSSLRGGVWGSVDASRTRSFVLWARLQAFYHE